MNSATHNRILSTTTNSIEEYFLRHFLPHLRVSNVCFVVMSYLFPSLDHNPKQYSPLVSFWEYLALFCQKKTIQQETYLQRILVCDNMHFYYRDTTKLYIRMKHKKLKNVSQSTIRFYFDARGNTDEEKRLNENNSFKPHLELASMYRQWTTLSKMLPFLKEQNESKP